LFIKNNLDFLEKAWKHKLHIIEEVDKNKNLVQMDSKIPGLNNILKKQKSFHNSEIIDIDKIC
jgi:hypothetical protein